MLRKICEKLVKRDPDIVEIIGFGSSVYAPEHARDLDLLVFTKVRKDYGVYLDATCDVYDELDFVKNIDVVPCEAGKQIDRLLGIGVLGAYEILYGDGSYLRDATRRVREYLKGQLENPTFEDAWSHITGVGGAINDFKSAKRAKSASERERCIREAFDHLFHSSRIASMVYLSIEETRWGKIRRMLPSPYGGEFREIANTLHIKYFYEGNYPREMVTKEFNKWLKKVEDYVRRLEAQVKGRLPP